MKLLKQTPVLLLLIAVLMTTFSCNKSAPSPKVKTGTFTINWFRDSTTTNPTAFLDLYNSKSYTMSGAAAKPDSIDLFIYDRSVLASSSQAISVINMVFFGNSNYSSAASFQAVVGTQALSTYNASTVSEISMTPAEFSGITYNSDIASLFASKALNGGYTDIDIQAIDLTNTLKYYQFVCAKSGKRGFFHVTSSNYLPGGYMTIEEKVEQ